MKNDKDKENWNNYFIDNTNILKNNLNIVDKEKLSETEKEITLKQLAFLELFPIEGNFDSNHLRAIHKFLFSSIYPFAGEYRTCSLAKKTEFYDPELIKDELSSALNELNTNIEKVYDKRSYSYVLANAYYLLMAIHPFREGNGRSVREFLREFVLDKNKLLTLNVKLDFSKMDKEKFLMAVQYRYIYQSLLEDEFFKALVPLKKEIENPENIVK